MFCISGRLQEIGLNVPQITRVMDRLREAGIDVPGGIYTTGDAYRVLAPMLK